MLRAVGNIAKGIAMSVYAAAAAPILAISEIVKSFSAFIG